MNISEVALQNVLRAKYGDPAKLPVSLRKMLEQEVHALMVLAYAEYEKEDLAQRRAASKIASIGYGTILRQNTDLDGSSSSVQTSGPHI